MQAGEKPQGLYTLTVPTGGGKTVSSMAFALRHALHNGARRIIYIIPYTSIIEQTQEIFEDIFGADNVVAHYANVEYPVDESGDLSEVDRRRYLAAENWDAPIILTTAVQFFESLFGNRPARCRKLHNIAGSVLEVVYEQTDTSDLRPHECRRISARFCGIPAQRNWTGRRRTESVSCWNTFSNRPTT